jgi:hypothetical protein
MNCNVTSRKSNVTENPMVSSSFGFLGAGLILFDASGQRNVTLTRLIELACRRGLAGKVLCITMGLCNFRRYNARHGGMVCRVVSYDA